VRYECVWCAVWMRVYVCVCVCAAKYRAYSCYRR